MASSEVSLSFVDSVGSIKASGSGAIVSDSGTDRFGVSVVSPSVLAKLEVSNAALDVSSCVTVVFVELVAVSIPVFEASIEVSVF